MLATANVPSPLLAKPGDMSLSEFFQVTERLRGKGLLAPFSSELKTMQREVNGAKADYRAMIARDKKAGRAPHSCPPKKPKAGRKEITAQFESYPVARRSSVSVRQAIYALMKRKYPCS